MRPSFGGRALAGGGHKVRPGGGTLLGRGKFGGGAGFRDGILFLLGFPLLGEDEATGAGMLPGEGVGDCFLQTELGRAVLDHGDPCHALTNEEVGIDGTQGCEETEESSERVHGRGHGPMLMACQVAGRP